MKEEKKAILKKDPAIKSKIEIYLYPSYKAMKYYKISNYFYKKKFYLLEKLIY